MMKFRSKTWKVKCAACGQAYTQKTIFAPGICPFCGSRWIAVMHKAEYLVEVREGKIKKEE